MSAKVSPALTTPAGSRGSWTLIVLLSFATLAAVVFWGVAAFPYLTTNRETFGPAPDIYWPRRNWLWVHITGGTLAMFTGPIQLWLGETRRKLHLHRLIGNVYLLGVVLGGLGAFYMASTTPLGVIFASGLFVMAIASFATTAMAYLAIRYRNFIQHREWMIRSYVVILSFVFFRFIVVGLEALGVGEAGDAGVITRLGLAAWSSWAFPMLITESFLQLPKLRRR